MITIIPKYVQPFVRIGFVYYPLRFQACAWIGQSYIYRKAKVLNLPKMIDKVWSYDEPIEPEWDFGNITPLLANSSMIIVP